MRMSLREKTKKDLVKIVGEGLAAVVGGHGAARRPLGARNVDAVSRGLVDRLFSDGRFLDCVGALASEKKKEWLTTEDAARMAGFSRPFVAALLDGPSFEGLVTRSEKGHRRVARDVFEQWLSERVQSQDLPKTIQEARSGPRDEEPPKKKETAVEKKKRLDASKRAKDIARGMGIA